MEIDYADLREMGILWKPWWIRMRARKGQFPKPIRGGRGDKGAFKWNKKDIEQWLKDRK